MENHYETFKGMDERYKIILNNDKYYLDEVLLYSFMNDFKVLLHDNIYVILEPEKEKPECEQSIRFYCKYIEEHILPLCNNKIESIKNQLIYATQKNDIELINKLNIRNRNWLDLEDDFFAMASMRNLRLFAFYLERGKPLRIRVWDKTMPIFESLFHYMQEMIFTGDINLIRASYFPGAGKTYAGNILCAYWFGYDINMTILRITYSDDLVQSFTGQIQNIISSDQFRKVFPQFDKPDKELYKKKNSDTIWFKGSESINFYARTRDGQSTGKRAKLLMIDDITKGQAEAYNISLHVSIVARYDTDWTSRADDDDLKVIALGTMWSRFDLLNIIQQRDEVNGQLKDDEDYKYTRVNKDKTSIYIGVPGLDYETDETTCPARYSTQYFRKKRDEMTDKALFNAVYQQHPEEPEELIFGYSRLNTYNEKTFPKEILEGNCECRAFIDPNRRAFDYFVCLFFKRYEIREKEYSKWYLCDAICKKKQFKQLKELIIAKIIKNNVVKLGVEINTSNELGDWIKDLLEEQNFVDIDIDEEYSVEKKEQKIAEQQDSIINECVFPEKGMFDSKSDMGCAMDWLTTYDSSGKNEHDDVPDCCAMFTKQNVGVDLENETTILGSGCRI